MGQQEQDSLWHLVLGGGRDTFTTRSQPGMGVQRTRSNSLGKGYETLTTVSGPQLRSLAQLMPFQRQSNSILAKKIHHARALLA